MRIRFGDSRAPSCRPTATATRLAATMPVVAPTHVAIGSWRLLFNSVVPPAQSTAYTSIHYAWLGLTGGLAPLLAGGLLAATGTWQTDLRWLSIDGYTLLFVTAFLFLGAGGLLYRRVRRDDGYTTRAAVRGFLNRVAQR